MAGLAVYSIVRAGQAKNEIGLNAEETGKINSATTSRAGGENVPSAGENKRQNEAAADAGATIATATRTEETARIGTSEAPALIAISTTKTAKINGISAGARRTTADGADDDARSKTTSDRSYKMALAAPGTITTALAPASLNAEDRRGEEAASETASVCEERIAAINGATA